MQHLAVIMDGNGRWAENKNLPRSEGHIQGAKAFEKALWDFLDMPFNYLTVYAFSTENNSRNKDEVSNILKVIAYFLEYKIYPFAKNNGITVNFIGDIDGLPVFLQETVKSAPSVCDAHKFVNIALNYGGIDEICRTCKKIIDNREDVNPETLHKYSDTHGMPDPDIILRYGGYKRLSNFLPMQSIYSELFFTDKYWPDYRSEDFLTVISQFEKIKRNFGGTDK